MLDGGVLSIRVLLRVAEGGICHSGRNGLDDELPHSVGVFPVNVAEEVVERLEDVRQPVQLLLASATPAGGRHRIDLGVLVRQQNLLHRPVIKPGRCLSSYSVTVS